MRLFKFFSILLVAFVGVVYYLETRSDLLTLNGKIFGTYYNIKIKTDLKNKVIENKVKDKLQEVNREMSVFDQSSEISKINQAAAEQPIALSEQMRFLMAAADKVYRESDGAFDPTVGQLINLWGFGPEKVTRIPTQAEIDAVLAYTGFGKLKFNTDYSSVQKSDSRIYINLSAIAKGYGVDQVAKLLEKEGYHDYLVDIGGEIRASGTRDGINAWSIGIARPSEKGNRNAFAMELTDYAIATSGDYRNFFVRDGRRYAHTISPQTGYPVEHSLASVTVLHPDTMLADAYATAIMAMGEVDGMKMAEKLDLPVIMFLRGKDDAITMQVSSAAQRLIGD